MKKIVLGGLSAVALLANGAGHAADLGVAVTPAPIFAAGTPADDNFFARLYHAYDVEWGLAAAPVDPNAPPSPPSRRAYWPATPETTPPMPFTEWPYGGATSLGVSRPNSVDSPLMVALGPTAVGNWLSDQHIQIYGWADVGGNASSNTRRPGGNAPAGYDYTPNTVTLDQFVVYVERVPDTVQKDHIDWGFRVSGLYGENYRYTTAYGAWSYQLLTHNRVYGYDTPMVYGELFFPQLAEGLLIRAGRFISLPDIEAQLAPNNYMYTHSFAYNFDNYTNTGVQATLAATKNVFLQFGVSLGSDTMPWNVGKRLVNPDPNPLFPGTSYLKDPGAIPSFTGCIRYQTDAGNDNIYLCADAENSGTWGYNNLQWYGLTYYHKFDEHWHISFETYELGQHNVPNLNNPIAASAVANGGTPFSAGSAFNGINFNAPNAAQCKNTVTLTCTTRTYTFLTYLNYSPEPLDNISLRAEFYNDLEGQRTGVATSYFETGLGWQHWFSPQVEIRPEVTYYRSFNAPAFNGNSAAGILPNRSWAVVSSGDLIWHF